MSCICFSTAICSASSSRRVTAASAAAFLRQCRATARVESRRQGHTSSTARSTPTTSPKPNKFQASTRTPTTERLFRRSSSSSNPPQHRSSFNRPFSSSTISSSEAPSDPLAPTTKVLQNPRTDDDGNEMLINISPRAASRLHQITSSDSPESPQHLRVTVTSGGCHGFQYLMSLEASEKISAEEDTIFASEPSTPQDAKAASTARVVLDEPSLELLKGSTIDYTTELIGSQFKIVGNPRAKSSCGCGTSFDIED